jgi:transcriptional regulator with XRE-family HTH domain
MIKNELTKWRGRRGRGISKAELARRIQVSRSYITKLENGKLQPSADMMFLGCSVEDIFKYVPEDKAKQ